MGNIRRDSSFVYFVILNLAVSLYLIFIEKHIFIGVIVLFFNIVIIWIHKNNKKENTQDISYDDIATVLPSMPFSVTITNIDKNINNSVIKSLFNRLYAIFGESNNTQNAKYHESVIKTKNGKQYLSQKKEIKDNNGNLLGIATIEIDVTNIMQYQEYMLNKQQVSTNIKQTDTSDLACNNSDGILVFAYNNTEKKILGYIDSNNSMRKMLHLTSESMINIDILDLFHISEKERVSAIICNMISNKPILFESLMINSEEYFPVEISAHCCKIYNQNAIYFSVRDVRFRKEQEMKRDKNRILSTRHSKLNLYLLHILFTKTAIYANIIKEHTKNIENIYTESKLEISEINTQVESITNTIRDLIVFYTPTNIKTYVNIKLLLEHIQKIIFPKEILNNTTITIIQKYEIVDVYCDEDALKYCLVAIICNAIESISINKGTNFYGKIDIALQKVESNILISIEDNAGGIDEHIIDRVFDVFYSNKSYSAGLGLPIVKILVEDALFGSISISNANYGAKIDILIAG